MLIYLLRHGLTEYNAEKRYQGQRDIPLSAAGRAMLCRADISPKTVYITPLCRTRQTAEVLFPGAKLVETDGLKEMCFGSFEGRNYIEMEHDPDYLAWVAANCESPCPDGETKAAFCERICAAFSALVDKALADGEEMLVILAHGGTQMAAMERYALPHKDYYEWCAPNAGGFVLDAKDWTAKRVLYLVKTGSTQRRRRHDRLRGIGRLCAGCRFRRPGVAAAPGSVYGQSHLCAGKRAACPPAQNAKG